MCILRYVQGIFDTHLWLMRRALHPKLKNNLIPECYPHLPTTTNNSVGKHWQVHKQVLLTLNQIKYCQISALETEDFSWKECLFPGFSARLGVCECTPLMDKLIQNYAVTIVH